VPAERFARFDVAPVINDEGQVAFLVGPELVPGKPFAGNTSVWKELDGSLRAVAATGAPAPGLEPGTAFGNFFGLNWNDAGHTAFGSLLTGATVHGDNRRAIWCEDSEGLQLVARQGDRAPGTDKDTAFADFVTDPAFNGAGQVLFFADVRQAGPNQPATSGLWAGTAGAVKLISRAGDHAPGAGEDVRFLAQMFESPFSNRPRMNSAGGTAVLGFLEGPNVAPESNGGIWSNMRSDTLQLVARNGDTAPGTGPNTTYLSFTSPPAINDAGHVAFLAFLTTAGAAPTRESSLHDTIGPVNHLGLWSDRSSALDLVVRIGDEAPGVEPSAHFVDFENPLLNGQGRLAFGAAVSGPGVGAHNEVGIWSEGRRGAGKLELVARSGDAAPGTEPGVKFVNFLSPALNGAGQIAFGAVLTGAGVGQAEGNALGVWAEDRSGELHLIARTGDAVEVEPGDVRTIAFLDFASDTGGEDGRPRGWNDVGQLAFRARFTDGSSGIFVSSAVSVPEPANCGMPFAWLGVLLICKGNRARVRRASL
jgi:hypothetical protein